MILVSIACSGGGGDERASKSASVTVETPVRIARVRLDTLLVQITVPGRTEVLRTPTVRAPFAGVLTALTVSDGDRVRTGEALGTIVSMSSQAALDGARSMLSSARTAVDSADARRALAMARENRVTLTLRASADGVVLGHSASPGDRLGEGDEILRLASDNSSVFIANVPQSEAARVRPGQPALVRLASSPDTIRGAVHGVLPAADSGAFSVPVQIDIGAALDVPSVGLFGTATITVGRESGVLSVPVPAVLTDDISGVSRVARVEHGRARWVVVRKGVQYGGRVAVTAAALAAGDTTIVSGQVGLPDSTRVRVSP